MSEKSEVLLKETAFEDGNVERQLPSSGWMLGMFLFALLILLPIFAAALLGLGN